VQARVNARGVLSELYRMTPLEETYSINNVRPRQTACRRRSACGDLCNLYAEHRLDVVRRAVPSTASPGRRDRVHIVEGLLIALDAIELVISIIRSSQDAA